MVSFMPSSYSRQITTRNISTAAQATVLLLHSGGKSPYLLMRPYFCQQGREFRTFQRWLTCQLFCRNKIVTIFSAVQVHASHQKGQYPMHARQRENGR